MQACSCQYGISTYWHATLTCARASLSELVLASYSASVHACQQAAAAMGQGSVGRQQQPSRAPQPQLETAGAPQMILDEETGQLVLDRSSLTMQAQPREEYTRREEGQHDTVNSQSYMKRENTARWSPEETEEFYAVGSQTPSSHAHLTHVCKW